MVRIEMKPTMLAATIPAMTVPGTAFVFAAAAALLSGLDMCNRQDGAGRKIT